jgi:hypothetical protein
MVDFLNEKALGDKTILDAQAVRARILLIPEEGVNILETVKTGTIRLLQKKILVRL